MNEEQSTSSIETKLQQAWAQERRYIHMRGASRFVIWLIALLVLDFLIDWGMFSKAEMSGGIGVILLLVNICVLAWILWKEWLRYLRPYDPLLVALDVENRHPNLSSLVVSYIQLDKPSSDQPNVSGELIAAMRAQAVTTAKPFDFRDIVDFRQLKNLFMVAIGVLLVFGIFSISWGDYLGTLFQRLVGVDAAYPTQTTVGKVTGPRTVRIGDPATISATASGVIPDEGLLLTRRTDDNEDEWKELPMKRQDIAGRISFTRELKDLTEDLEYRVVIGDGRSKIYRVDVVRSPRIVSSEVIQSFPGYINLAAIRTEELNLKVPEGTTIKWRLESDLKIKSFEVETDRDGDEKLIKAQVDETEKILTFETEANETFKYTFRWTESESGENFEFDDVQYSVRVVADTPPGVDLLRPRSNMLAAMKKTLHLAARANDDHGLNKAWLVYSHDGAEEIKIPIRDFSAAPGKEFTYQWELAKDIKDLKINSQVTFAIEVSDHYPEEGEHLRRSATRQLTIVDDEEYMKWYRRELAAQMEEIKKSRDAEKTSAQKLKDLKIQEEEPEQ